MQPVRTKQAKPTTDQSTKLKELRRKPPEPVKKVKLPKHLIRAVDEL